MKIYMLSSDIQLTKGIHRSLLVDLTRGNYHLISKEWAAFIDRINGCKVKDILNGLNNEEVSSLNKLIKFLQQNDYLIVIDEENKSWFPKISTGYETPFIFDLCFCELTNDNFDTFNSLMRTVHSRMFGGFYIFIYEISDTNIMILKDTINSIPPNKNITVRGDEVVLKRLHFDQKINVFIKITDCHSNKVMRSILYREFPIMNIGIKQFLESEAHNTFYNKTLFINEKGEVINSPFINNPLIFTTIDNIIDNDKIIDQLLIDDDFTKFWDLDNTKILPCKHCEFRRVCIDCRPPIYKNGKYFRKDCIYNPHLMEWNETN